MASLRHIALADYAAFCTTLQFLEQDITHSNKVDSGHDVRRGSFGRGTLLKACFETTHVHLSHDLIAQWLGFV